MKKLNVIVPIIAVAIISGLISISYVLAEKPTGDTPESGATSYIKATYDSIVALGHGSVAAGAWGDWGSYWNRIRSAAEWVPSGDAEVTDVVSGKTYYKDSRSETTGTKLVAEPCSTQAYHDNYGAPVTEGTNCSKTWTTNSSPVTGDDNRSPGGNFDPVTGLTWSMPLKRTDTTIGFASATNTAFSWGNTHANNIGITAPVAGDRTAVQLCADQGNGWRLPTQKELMQAYIDGSYWNLTQPSNTFWSATESTSTDAWVVRLNSGITNTFNKTDTYQLRCVR
jgi:hypothetical protein